MYLRSNSSINNKSVCHEYTHRDRSPRRTEAEWGRQTSDAYRNRYYIAQTKLLGLGDSYRGAGIYNGEEQGYDVLDIEYVSHE